MTTESTVEEAALEWFLLRQGDEGRKGYEGQVGELGYALGHGPDIAPGEPAARVGAAEGGAR